MRPRKTILLVDQNEQRRSVRAFLLDTRGYRVVPVVTTREALEIVDRSAAGSIDLLLADLHLGPIDGNQLIAEAKQRNPDLRTMLVSSLMSSDFPLSRADVFLGKDNISPGELLERVKLLCRRKRGPKPRQKPSPIQATEADLAVARVVEDLAGSIRSLQRRRRQMKVSLHVMGTIVGVGRNTVHRWETFRHEPKVSEYLRWKREVERLESERRVA